MFSFVDMRLALLLSAAVLLVRAQGEEDRKFHLYWSFSTLTTTTHNLLHLLTLFRGGLEGGFLTLV